MSSPRDQFSLTQWLSWVEKMHPTEIELGLGRVRDVFLKLELDLSKIQLVTVGGTNGKGSTISYLSSMLAASGYRYAAYTSPHFLRYNERVKLNGEEATDQELCSAFRAIDAVRGDVSLTYFEWGTLVALWLIAEHKPDVALLEVGLGGRLDAINIVDADIAVVTSIGLDHIDWLGDDIEGIAVEKAGIARKDRPLVCGADPVPASLARTSDEIGAVLYQKGELFSAVKDDDLWHWQGVDREGREVALNDLPLPGLPFPNAATAIQVATLLPQTIDRQAICHGLTQAKVTGRMQVVDLPEGRCLLDVAHNPQAAELICERLSDYKGKIKLVLGMLADKDIESVISILAPLVDKWYLASLTGPRAQTSENLAEMMAESALFDCFDDVPSALNSARTELKNDQLILVAGSFFTVAAALDSFKLDQ